MKTLWHQAFQLLMLERGPDSSLVHTEFNLPREFGRVDLVIERRPGVPPSDDQATFLRGLWPLLGRAAVADFKSPSRGYRATDLARLYRYGAEYIEYQYRQKQVLVRPDHVLFVPTINKALRTELEFFKSALKPVESAGHGYYRVVGKLAHPAYVVVFAEVAKWQGDDYAAVFTQRRSDIKREARRWLTGWLEEDMDKRDAEGFEQLLEIAIGILPPERLLAGVAPEQRLAGLAPEQRLAGLAPEQLRAALTPEQRLAGLAPEQRLAGLAPEQRLAGLAPEQRLAGLTPEQRAELVRLLMPDSPGEMKR